MNKIAQYLNEHVAGEVTCNDAVLKQFSRDGSVLAIKPEIVAHPRSTSDIRKIARFSWQLAEKGHLLPITPRGGGSDQTGGAIGTGIIIDTMSHLCNILNLNLKHKHEFVHVQPGVVFRTLNDTLKTHGLILPPYPASSAASTVGGAVANNTGGRLSGSYGLIGDYVERLEVVLANGDLIETGRINKREVAKKKGQQTLEGEIYRRIDAIIEDNKELIKDKIENEITDNTGYPGIVDIKRKDGSFDLTPLFLGSQGTLGIVSEIVFKVEAHCGGESIIVAVFENPEIARDAADQLEKFNPLSIEYIDGEYYKIASVVGKKYLFDDVEKQMKVGAVLFVNFNDHSEHLRKKKTKQSLKVLSKLEAKIFTNKEYSGGDLNTIREVSSVVMMPEQKDVSMPPIFNGCSIPVERREEFIVSVKDLASKNHMTLPIHIQWLDGIVHTRPQLNLRTVGDRQKVFKMINNYVEIVIRCGGSIAGQSAEGRTKAYAAHEQFDADVLDLYRQIRDVFDPYGTLNPGVKQKNELKMLVTHLDPEYSLADFAKYSPKD